MRVLLTIYFIAQCALTSAQNKPVQQPADMQQDFAYLRHYLETTHPMLYLYHTKEEMTYTLDSIAATLQRPLPFLEFYKKIAFVIAQVGCEHSSANYGSGFEKMINNATLFPFQLYFLPHTAQILVNRTRDTSIEPGDELLTINSYPIDSIRQVLYQYIPADARINSAKDVELSSMAFNVWYYMFIEQPRSFTVTIRKRDGRLITKTVDGEKMKQLNKLAVANRVNKPLLELDKRLRNRRKQPLHLELLPEPQAAVLSVQTFSMDMSTFRHTIDSFFTVIKQNEVQTLIVDLTNNGGGEVELAADFLNYFITAPASIVPYSYLITDRDEDLQLANIPDEIRQSKYDYLEPLKNGKAYTKLSKYAGELKKLEPKPERFNGKVYLLVNGGTASAASCFAAVMKGMKLATIVGQETIGGYAGGGTAVGLDLKLPNSGITAHSGLVYQRFNTTDGDPNRGVLPDIPFIFTMEDLISSKRPWIDVILHREKR